MKKTNTKTKSPAPATTKPAKKKAARVAAPTPPAEPAIAPVAVAPAANPLPPVRPTAPAPVRTRIIAKIDVGYGNVLYVRGDGPGLTWGQGIPMECVASDQWELTLGESERPVSFKILLNDANWCTGPDAVVASGSTITVTPEFC